MSATSVSNLNGTPRSAGDSHQQTSAATSDLSGAQQVSQEEWSVSGVSVTAATEASERHVCLGVLPFKVKAKGGARVVETYALLDSGREVTLCKEQLFNTGHGARNAAMTYKELRDPGRFKDI